MSRRAGHLPLIYSCSGCSSAAQMAHALALRADREGLAEMSCIAGVGGDVAPLVRKAQSGRPMLVLDGCHLQCARHCLAQREVQPEAHVLLSEYGVRKRYQADYEPEQFETLWVRVQAELAALRADGDPSRRASTVPAGMGDATESGDDEAESGAPGPA